MIETILFSVLAVIGIVGTVFSLWFNLKMRSDGKLVDNAKQYSANLLNQAEEEKRKVLLEAQGTPGPERPGRDAPPARGRVARQVRRLKFLARPVPRLPPPLVNSDVNESTLVFLTLAP